MKDIELDNIYQLISSSNTSKLGFKLAEGFGYSKVDIVGEIWDRRKKHDSEIRLHLTFNNYTLIRNCNDVAPWNWQVEQHSDNYYRLLGGWVYKMTAIEYLAFKL